MPLLPLSQADNGQSFGYTTGNYSGRLNIVVNNSVMESSYSVLPRQFNSGFPVASLRLDFFIIAFSHTFGKTIREDLEWKMKLFCISQMSGHFTLR